MELVDGFGAVAVAAMVLFYALEERSAWFILLFALACLASSGYAVVIQSWPFAVVELLWAGLALWRWVRARTDLTPLTCIGPEPMGSCLAGRRDHDDV